MELDLICGEGREWDSVLDPKSNLVKIESDKSNMENVIGQASYPKLLPTVKSKSYADAVKKQTVRRKGILKVLNR